MLTKSKNKISPAKKAEEKRRKRVLEAHGMFANVPSSSSSFAKRKPAEIRRENRHAE